MSETATPPRKIYKGSITDTTRWSLYTHRAGDVFVCTPPKCGTTWTTAIVAMLLNGRTDISSHNLVQWVDANIKPSDEVRAILESQDRRRCLKTHSPFDGIPWHPTAHYISVYRHPVDMLLSLRKHLQNAYITRPDHPYLESNDAALRNFVETECDPENYDLDSLSNVVAYYQSYLKEPRPDNLLLLHYSDMLSDPKAAVRKIAAHIKVDASDKLIQDVTDASSFDSMKANADQHAPFASDGFWRDPKAFFHSGGSRKREEKVGPEALALYREKSRSLLDDERLAWLENGDGGWLD